MIAKDKEHNILHSWGSVIIPVGNRDKPYFAAHCKNCNSYFTQELKITTNPRGYSGKIELPKWGCINPMEGLHYDSI